MELKNIVIAHRGIHDNKFVPENSIKSFILAIKNNLAIELDVHILKDNNIVVFHDDNLYRMTGINKKIKDMTYKELLKLNLLNTTYTIPTLDEVLNLVNGKVILDIEIKNDKRFNDMAKYLCKKLDCYRGKFIIKSFYPEIINWFRVNRPNYIRGILLPFRKDNLFKSRKLLINKINPYFLAVNKNMLKSKFVLKQRKKGIIIIAWTIKNINDISEYKNYADSFLVDIKPSW